MSNLAISTGGRQFANAIFPLIIEKILSRIVTEYEGLRFMGIINMGPPQDLILAAKQLIGANVFVETGTFRGDTTKWASQHFSRVVTIEASLDFYRKAVERFSSQENVTVLHGSSRDCLRDVVDALDETAVFWLDAHWSGGETYGDTDECPVLDEISLIMNNDLQNSIFIDDARLFFSPPPLPHDLLQWPEIGTIIVSLKPIHNYVTVFEDVIISIPQSSKTEFSRLLQQKNTSNWNAQTKPWLYKLATKLARKLRG